MKIYNGTIFKSFGQKLGWFAYEWVMFSGILLCMHVYTLKFPAAHPYPNKTFFFFCWWCCHGVTTQVFYSKNMKYRYHMQSWIWIWYICLNYSLQKIICLKPTTPEGCDWLNSIPKCNKSRDQGKILAEREAKLEQGLASTIRKEPSQNSQKWWASKWIWESTIMKASIELQIHHILKLIITLNMTTYPGIL